MMEIYSNILIHIPVLFLTKAARSVFLLVIFSVFKSENLLTELIIIIKKTKNQQQ